jgi:hypothetical protein
MFFLLLFRDKKVPCYYCRYSEPVYPLHNIQTHFSLFHKFKFKGFKGKPVFVYDLNNERGFPQMGSFPDDNLLTRKQLISCSCQKLLVSHSSTPVGEIGSVYPGS